MRLFVSVSLTDEMKKCVLYHRNMLKDASVRGRYPHSDNYHITLAFIGEFDDPSKVTDALANVRQEPITVSAGGIGSFGSTYFVRVSSESGSLDKLAEAVREALRAAGIPFDKKRFKGHITIGRDVDCHEIPHISRKVVMTVSSFSLMRSDVIGGKRVYRSIGDFLL